MPKNPLTAALTSGASRIHSRDTRNNVLWYLRRFYLQESRTYGVEWRITRRLIEEIGSRLTGTIGLVFFGTESEPDKDDGNSDPSGTPEVIGKIGIKPRYMSRNWLDFCWRPIEAAEQAKAAEKVDEAKQLEPTKLSLELLNQTNDEAES